MTIPPHETNYNLVFVYKIMHYIVQVDNQYYYELGGYQYNSKINELLMKEAHFTIL